MVYGLTEIANRELFYFDTDFPSIPRHEHLSRSKLIATWVEHAWVFRLLTIWFAGTIVAALVCALLARKRRHMITHHRNFIIRHVASGIWVALQRLYTGILNPMTPELQKETFGDGALLGPLITIFCAELALLALQKKAPKVGAGGRTAAGGDTSRLSSSSKQKHT